jgi:hypothetical protein
MENRTALTHEDVSGNHFFAAEDFHAKALALRITAVSATAACFFVCHCISPSAWSRRIGHAG